MPYIIGVHHRTHNTRTHTHTHTHIHTHHQQADRMSGFSELAAIKFVHNPDVTNIHPSRLRLPVSSNRLECAHMGWHYIQHWSDQCRMLQQGLGVQHAVFSRYTCPRQALSITISHQYLHLQHHVWGSFGNMVYTKHSTSVSSSCSATLSSECGRVCKHEADPWNIKYGGVCRHLSQPLH